MGVFESKLTFFRRPVFCPVRGPVGIRATRTMGQD
jgi:hypothetical protein